MKLNGPQFQQTQDALLDAYTEFGLRQMLRVQMDVDLDRVAGGDNLTEITFNLLRWAERNGQVAGLIKAAHAGNQENPMLATLAADARGWFVDQNEGPRSLDDVAPAKPQAAHQVFLSYSRKDSQQMRIIQRALTDAGLSVWTDEGLAVGTHSWENAIEQAINEAACMVVLMSPDAKRSKWVQTEVSYALEIGLDVLPILLRGRRRESIPLSLWTVQFEDGRCNLAAACDRLLDVLGRAAQTTFPRTVASHADVSAQPTKPKPAGSSVPAQEKQPRNPVINTPIDFDWITIPAGEFWMGEDEAQHAINLPEYHITRFPVTNEQYKRFVDATGQEAPEHWENGKIPAGKESHPVVYVSWRDAQVFCKWAGVQLPTEAQWEKAARGTDGRTYPWGEGRPTSELCNFGGNEGGTTPVGKYSPKGDSRYGLADVAGNVWEWTGSVYKPYPYNPDDGREDFAGDGDRTLRGGAWLNPDYYVRCALRDRRNPNYRRGSVGFRVVSPGAVGR